MAVIPELYGKVVKVETAPLADGYYKSQVTLIEAVVYGNPLTSNQTVKTRWFADQLLSYQGKKVRMLAFPVGDNTWEAEGLSEVKE